MFRDAPYAVRWAGWYVVILGLLQLPLFFYAATKLERISDPELYAALTVYAGIGALIRTPIYIVPAFAMVKGFRPAFPVVLLLMGGSLFFYLSHFGEMMQSELFSPLFVWAALLTPVPALLNLATPSAWKWFLGLDGPKHLTRVIEPRSFELPRRQ
jgi:hypothetical protein